MKIILICFIFYLSNPLKAQNLQSFIPPEYKVMDSLSFDFNFDKITDKILILERIVIDEDSFWVHGKRPFLILEGQGDSKYKLKVRNDNLILDSESGGMYGDPYQGMNIDGNTIYIFYYGGTSWRWDLTHYFTYNKEKDIWYLTKETSSSFWIWNVDSTMTEEVKNYSEDDNITIQDFNIDN
jgi:hypothetical protein